MILISRFSLCTSVPLCETGFKAISHGDTEITEKSKRHKLLGLKLLPQKQDFDFNVFSVYLCTSVPLCLCVRQIFKAISHGDTENDEVRQQQNQNSLRSFQDFEVKLFSVYAQG